jgi:Flp pilus assembly protein TadG
VALGLITDCRLRAVYRLRQKRTLHLPTAPANRRFGSVNVFVRDKFPTPRRGAAVIEAVLVLPFFVTLVMGAIEFASYYYLQQAATSAVRDAMAVALRNDASCTTFNNVLMQALETNGVYDPEDGQPQIKIDGVAQEYAVLSGPIRTGAVVELSYSINFQEAGGVRTLMMLDQANVKASITMVK